MVVWSKLSKTTFVEILHIIVSKIFSLDDQTHSVNYNQVSVIMMFSLYSATFIFAMTI